MTLPTREEAADSLTIYRGVGIDRNYAPDDAVAADVLAAYADGNLMSRAEWEATIGKVVDEVWLSASHGDHEVRNLDGHTVDTVMAQPGYQFYAVPDDAAIGETDDE